MDADARTTTITAVSDAETSSGSSSCFAAEADGDITDATTTVAAVLTTAASGSSSCSSAAADGAATAVSAAKNPQRAGRDHPPGFPVSSLSVLLFSFRFLRAFRFSLSF